MSKLLVILMAFCIQSSLFYLAPATVYATPLEQAGSFISDPGTPSFATPQQIAPTGGGNFDLPQSTLTPQEMQSIYEKINTDLQQMRSKGVLPAPDPQQTVFYDWPVRLAPGSADYAGFSISAFADHNSASGPWKDYTGGSRTYDGHRGTDIALWPFSWNKLDSGEVQVVAAAAGTLIEIQNINPSDHNCGSGSGGLGNWVVVSHADGQITIYGHMKYNSLTTKAVGQTVEAGEVIGTVGSSGNSSGPHLHFEVRSALGGSDLWVDPFSGSANPVPSGWKNQRPYMDSAINKLATSSAYPVNEDCQPTVTNLQDNFTSPAHISFQVHYRDYQGTLPTQLKIYDPDGGVYKDWTYTDNTTIFTRAASRYWFFDFPTDALAGKWRFEAVYNGQVYQTFFNLNNTPGLSLTSPNGGETWDILRSYDITWKDNFSTDLTIALYYNDSFRVTIASSTPNDGVYEWVPGFSYTPGPGYSIRISSLTNPALTDQSDAPFTLAGTSLTKAIYLPLMFK
jgi:hypothetical protein